MCKIANSTTKITVLWHAGCRLLLTAAQLIVLMIVCDEIDVIKEYYVDGGKAAGECTASGCWFFVDKVDQCGGRQERRDGEMWGEIQVKFMSAHL